MVGWNPLRLFPWELVSMGDEEDYDATQQVAIFVSENYYDFSGVAQTQISPLKLYTFLGAEGTAYGFLG